MATFGRTHMMAVVIKRFLTQLKRHEQAAYEALPAELRQRYAPSQAQLLAKGSKDADNRAKTRQQVAEDTRLFRPDWQQGSVRSSPPRFVPPRRAGRGRRLVDEYVSAASLATWHRHLGGRPAMYKNCKHAASDAAGA